MGAERPRFVGVGTSLAVALLALSAALIVVFSQKELSPALLGVTLSSLALYTLAGTVVLARWERHDDARRVPLLLAAMVLLAGVAVVASHGLAALSFFAVVSMGVLYLSRARSLGIAAVAAVTLFASFAGRAPNPWQLLAGMISYVAGIAFVVVFSRMVRRQHEQRAELARLAGELSTANERLRASAREIESLAAAAERNRIAREIHDGVGHSLTVVHVQLEAAELWLLRDGERARTALQTARRLTHEGLDELRRSVAVLREGAPATPPLQDVLAALAEECAGAGLDVKLAVRGEPRTLPSPVTVTLFRAAQEAFTNVQRHARARRVDVDLGFDRPGRVWLRLADDGVGAAAPSGGFGLVGLRERVALVGGNVDIRSAPGSGFAIEIEVPA